MNTSSFTVSPNISVRARTWKSKTRLKFGTSSTIKTRRGWARKHWMKRINEGKIRKRSDWKWNETERNGGRKKTGNKESWDMKKHIEKDANVHYHRNGVRIRYITNTVLELIEFKADIERSLCRECRNVPWVSQLVPTYPSEQEHENPKPDWNSEQVPPLRQGVDEQENTEWKELMLKWYDIWYDMIWNEIKWNNEMKGERSGILTRTVGLYKILYWRMLRYICHRNGTRLKP